MTTIQGYLAAFGWSKVTDGDAIAIKYFPGCDGQFSVSVYLTFGRGQAEHVLSAKCLYQGRDMLSDCTLPLPRSEPVFMATIKGFVQDIEQVMRSVVE